METWTKTKGADEWTQWGVNWDNAKPITIHARYRRGGVDFVVFNIPGGSHWAGRGAARASHRGIFHCIEVTDEVDETTIKGNLAFEFPVTKEKK